MNKEEIQNKIDLISADRDTLERTRNKLTGDIALLLQKITELKPKLRHGDFGIWIGPGDEESNTKEFIHLLSGGKLRPADNIEYYDKQTTEESNYFIFGNIFDLMKEWSEDLEEFDFDVHNYKIDPDQRHAPIKVAGTWVTLAEAEENRNKLSRLIATLKRKNPQE